MKTMTIIKEMQTWINNEDNVSPGQPFDFSEACSVNDGVRQGDLQIVIADPNNPIRATGYDCSHYIEIKPKVKLVLESTNTEGSKHCLEHLDGVTMLADPEWNEESLEGPRIIFAKANRILHPVHGSVGIPAGFCVDISYPRNLTEDEKALRRARD